MGCFVSCRISTDKRVARSLCHSRATCYPRCPVTFTKNVIWEACGGRPVTEEYGPLSPYNHPCICLSLCLFVCLSAARITRKLLCQFYQIFVHDVCGHSSVLLRGRCDTLNTSGFVDEITFSYHMTGGRPTLMVYSLW